MVYNHDAAHFRRIFSGPISITRQAKILGEMIDNENKIHGRMGGAEIM